MNFRSKSIIQKTKLRWQLYRARLTDKTRPKLSARARLAVRKASFALLHILLSTLNKSCHTSTAHPSSSSTPPTQETSNVCNDCDGGGHPTQNAAAARPLPERTPKLERCALRWDRESQSPFVPHVLASGIVWASNQICTRAVLPAASR